jgi:sugar phosphate isomerase/epimerase
MILLPNRRAFLAGASMTSLGLLAGCSGQSDQTSEAISAKTPGYLSLLGVQLYTVRDLFEADARGTLEALAQIGIKDCETAGLFEYSAADIRAIMDDNGLISRSGHVRLEWLRDDAAFGRALEDAATLGQDRLYLGWIPEEERAIEKYRTLAELLNKRGEEAKAAGMKVGYHNHDFEFIEEDGTTGYDILLGETDPELVTMELDVYWVAHAKLDPSAVLQATPNRFSALHLKDRAENGDMASVGDGTIDFANVLPLAESLGVERFYIEHDNPEEPLVSVGRSYAHLTA